MDHSCIPKKKGMEISMEEDLWEDHYCDGKTSGRILDAAQSKRM
jgi:hypothetical protein